MNEKKHSTTLNRFITIAVCVMLLGAFRTVRAFGVSEYTDASTKITFNYNIVNNYVVITGMDRDTLPEDGTLTIPDEIGGKPVRARVPMAPCHVLAEPPAPTQDISHSRARFVVPLTSRANRLPRRCANRGPGVAFEAKGQVHDGI
jgi:hypothetical protein